jgi:hypothetical protein
VQFTQQCPRLFQVERFEAFGKPAIDWREEIVSLLSVSRKREPTTALAELTQIMCVSVVKHMHKDTKGHGRGDHLARGAAPEVEP